jgi:hypothetical protein
MLLMGLAAVALFFWRPHSFYYEAGQVALWFAAGVVVLSPIIVWDFWNKQHAAQAEYKRWAKMLDAALEREGTVSG